MPKYTKQTAILKAKKLTRLYLHNNLNQSAVARQENVSRQNINQKLKNPIVQDMLQKFMNSNKLKKAWIEVGIDGLQAERSISAVILVNKNGEVIKADDHGGIMTKDYHARHKYWHDLGLGMGILKTSGDNNSGTKIINIIHAYRNQPTISSVRS